MLFAARSPSVDDAADDGGIFTDPSPSSVAVARSPESDTLTNRIGENVLALMPTGTKAADVVRWVLLVVAATLISMVVVHLFKRMKHGN